MNVKNRRSKTIIDSKGFFGAMIAGGVALTVGILANLDNIHRFFVQGPVYQVLLERADVEIDNKIGFDGISMVPHESRGTANVVYFTGEARGTQIGPTDSKPVGSPVYFDAGGNKYAIHLLKLSQAPPKILTVKVEKKIR